MGVPVQLDSQELLLSQLPSPVRAPASPLGQWKGWASFPVMSLSFLLLRPQAWTFHPCHICCWKGLGRGRRTHSSGQAKGVERPRAGILRNRACMAGVRSFHARQLASYKGRKRQRTRRMFQDVEFTSWSITPFFSSTGLRLPFLNQLLNSPKGASPLSSCWSGWPAEEEVCAGGSRPDDLNISTAGPSRDIYVSPGGQGSGWWRGRGGSGPLPIKPSHSPAVLTTGQPQRHL